ncbi:hypothetical protein ACFL6M_01015 [Candidatus Eisenbacteria bacterium]|uniref:Uncharacterized protein n=1 Tax=Eiseniibacteriota bacterium TaxID=2212470 RepID=A0ABV6YIJ6_UNCEI
MNSSHTSTVCERFFLAVFMSCILACSIGGCGGQADKHLPAPETFRWSEKPITFSPPPENWKRQKAQSNGRSGVRFERFGAPWGRIIVAEYYPVGRRDRRAPLAELIADTDRLSENEFSKRLQRVQFLALDPVYDEEREIARRANNALSEARTLHRKGDRADARRSLDMALRFAYLVEYELDDFLDEVLVTADQFVDADDVYISTPFPDSLAGVATQCVSYRMRHDGFLYSGLEIWALVDNHLFTLDCLGTRSDSLLFERILDTVSFPPLELPQ